jgi:hypothetical protein
MFLILVFVFTLFISQTILVDIQYSSFMFNQFIQQSQHEYDDQKKSYDEVVYRKYHMLKRKRQSTNNTTQKELPRHLQHDRYFHITQAMRIKKRINTKLYLVECMKKNSVHAGLFKQLLSNMIDDIQNEYVLDVDSLFVDELYTAIYDRIRNEKNPRGLDLIWHLEFNDTNKKKVWALMMMGYRKLGDYQHYKLSDYIIDEYTFSDVRLLRRMSFYYTDPMVIRAVFGNEFYTNVWKKSRYLESNELYALHASACRELFKDAGFENYITLFTFQKS